MTQKYKGHPIDEKVDGYHVYYPECRVFSTAEEARGYIDLIGGQPYPTVPARHPAGCSCGAPDCPEWIAAQLGAQ